jgi:hypothetical protein
MTTNALAQALARHKAAESAIDAFEDDPDGYPEHLGTAEFDAIDDLAETPCAQRCGIPRKAALSARLRNSNIWAADWST